MNVPDIPRPYQIDNPGDILTPDILKCLEILFGALRLSIREIYFKLPGKAWDQFPGASVLKETNEAPFCAYLRSHPTLGEICSQDRRDCLRRSSSFGLVHWSCPFGLRLMGIGFQIGEAQFFLRSSGWREMGNEGIILRNTLERMDSPELKSAQYEILSRLRKQPVHTLSEFKQDEKSLAGVIKLVYDQARQRFESEAGRRKNRLLEKVSELVVPLMSGIKDDKQTQPISQALDLIRSFFGLQGCAFYVSRRELSERLSLVQASIEDGVAPPEIAVAAFRLAEPLSEGAAAVSRTVEGGPLGAYACAIRYPLKQTAILMAWPGQGEEGPLDDRSFSELTRLLSMPLCVARLVAELRQEADLRVLQSRNMAHTIGSNFQGVMGDVEAIRCLLKQKLVQIPPSLLQTLEHLEDLISYLSNLLRSQEIVEHRLLKTTRGPRFDRQSARIWDILEEAKANLRRRGETLRIEIVLNPSLNELDVVQADHGALSLLFLLLLDNALKYSHRGTSTRTRKINVKGAEDATHVFIEVSDFGLGIHPQEADRIFEPYVQGSITDDTRPISGQGIGLAAAREIARVHGGDLVLEKCVAYRENGARIPDAEIVNTDPKSAQASAVLQHCLVVFKLSLPKK